LIEIIILNQVPIFGDLKVRYFRMSLKEGKKLKDIGTSKVNFAE